MKCLFILVLLVGAVAASGDPLSVIVTHRPESLHHYQPATAWHRPGWAILGAAGVRQQYRQSDVTVIIVPVLEHYGSNPYGHHSHLRRYRQHDHYNDHGYNQSHFEGCVHLGGRHRH